MKTYRFYELSKAAKAKALHLHKKYNNPKKLTDEELIKNISSPIWLFVKNGEMWNGLTN